jgi:hypothetical protein
MTISAATTVDPTVPLPLEDDRRLDAKWFSRGGCVAPDGGRFLVFIRGTLIGSFGPKDYGVRNAIIVGLAEDPKMHLGQLAEAFDISDGTLRLLRGIHKSEGMGPLLARSRRGREWKVTPARRRRLEKLFESGATVSEAHAKAGKKQGLSRATVGRIRLAWLARKESIESHAQPEAPAVVQLSLVVAPSSEEVASIPADAPPVEVELNALAPAEEPQAALQESALQEAADFERDVTFDAEPVKSTRFVQHLGAWLLIAVVHQLGLYRHAASAAAGRVEGRALRLAIDATVAALALYQRCVEGVRRLATSTSAALLLASGAPSPTWTRRVLGSLAADFGGAALHLLMAREYLEAAQADASCAGPVFYIDNHMRPYTGQHTLRRGWRMQDKRVLPGATDYYVHDEDGRPVARLAVPSHDSLTQWLSPIARLLRLGLGEEERILLAFDRGGAFPEQMAELRDEDFEFVTYERKPYRLLPASAFTEKLVIAEDDEQETLFFCELSRANLGAGRGRVRRIAARMPDGKQVNLLAISKRSAEALILVMRGRWVQENGFKHGVERWGLNQLDGRRVEPYAAGTIIPNPARRRLDRALRIARASEGEARNQLARLARTDLRRAEAKASLDHARAEQKRLLALRPATPKRAPIEETELAEKLVHHTVEYKMTLDTIRIACANAESDLAAELALHIPRAAEAKRTLANLFAAPGHIRVGPGTIDVCLLPAGTRPEQRAFAALLSVVNRWKLTLPGDHHGRRLHFRIPTIS